MNNKKKNNSLKNISEKIKKIPKNRNILIFLIFFLIATLLWFLNTLNKEYTTTMEIPLRYSNLPNEKEFIEELPYSIDITFSGDGYSILKIKLESFSIPLIINLNIHNLTRTRYNPDKYYILTKNLYGDVARRMGKNINIVSITPDTLFFNFLTFAHNKVPVKLNADYHIATDYMLTDDIKITPDSIIIRGDENIVSKTEFVETEYKDLGKIGGNLIYELLLNEIESIKYDKKTVSVKFPIKKFVEDKIEVTIKPVNFPENNKIVFIPDKVQVIYQVPLDYYNQIDFKTFNVLADFNKRKNNTIELEVESKNKKAKNYRTQPPIVHFLLEKK